MSDHVPDYPDGPDYVAPTRTRNIVQISACAASAYEPGAGVNYTSEVFCLCDDGSLWVYDGLWGKCKAIPQPEAGQ